jgi:putative transposase
MPWLDPGRHAPRPRLWLLKRLYALAPLKLPPATGRLSAIMSTLISLLQSLRGFLRSRAALHLEVLALRHQLQVLERSRPQRLRIVKADRCLWAWLSGSWTAWRSALVIVKPETVIARHRQGFRFWWTWKSRRRTGRPAVPTDVRALIRTMSRANPLWGAPRIHGEFLKLGLDVSQASVAKYMVRRDKPPSQTCRTFLANHLQQIAAADFFVVPTGTCRLLFVLVILAHERRRVVHIAVTDHPTAAWTAQQLRERPPTRDPRRAKVVEFPKGIGSPHWTISATGWGWASRPAKRNENRWIGQNAVPGAARSR